MNVSAIPLCNHRLDTAKNHQGGYRRIEKADVDNLQDGDQREKNKEQDSSAKPKWTFRVFRAMTLFETNRYRSTVCVQLFGLAELGND